MRIAVTGAGGSLGGEVTRLLAAADEHDIVALARRPIQLSGVWTECADYRDLASIRAALSGVDRLVFVSSDGDAAKLLVHHHNLLRAAVDNGVAHVVALSSVDADLDSPFCYAVTNGFTERLLRDTGCSFSIARASIYTEFFMRWLSQARASGEIRLPAANGRMSLVSRSDVARCLAAMAAAPATGECHDITGPESLDVAAIAALTEQAWRVPIRYVELTPSAFNEEMAGAGEDPWWMYAFSTMFDSVREQRWDTVSGEVVRLTGRQPLSLRDVLTVRR